MAYNKSIVACHRGKRCHRRQGATNTGPPVRRRRDRSGANAEGICEVCHETPGSS